VVNLNVKTRRGYRIADACEAVAIISSKNYVVQGGPALVRINQLGQTTMEIFNCSNHEMTIEIDSLVGFVERLSEEDKVGELNINEMTVNIQKKPVAASQTSHCSKTLVHFIACNAQCAGHVQAEVLGLVAKAS
jgi:hypothetical protein